MCFYSIFSSSPFFLIVHLETTFPLVDYYREETVFNYSVSVCIHDWFGGMVDFTQRNDKMW